MAVTDRRYSITFTYIYKSRATEILHFANLMPDLNFQFSNSKNISYIFKNTHKMLFDIVVKAVSIICPASCIVVAVLVCRGAVLALLTKQT